ncbi:MAG: RNA degradosome polyphosphate kinase [Lachnospiraceae bacterium]|nr:RNA degradosome polyphosphate kinase [Lachnospiraceae bacterium]
MATENIDFKNPQYYINRELSWIEFDRRCLSEARNKENPLLERLKFLSITASNLDEFFMVRVASLRDMVQAGYKKKDIAGMTASEQLTAVLEATHTFMQQQYWTLNRQLLPALEEQKICMVRDLDELSKADQRFVEDYFISNVFPVLTPMAVDSSRPFPLIRNKSLNIGALLTRKESAAPGILGTGKKSKKAGKNPKAKYEFATVQVPGVLPRILVLPRLEGEPARLVLLEDIIRRFLPMLFVNYEIKCAGPYRIMRSADLEIAEDEAEDLLKEIQKQLKKRQRGDAIRLEVEKGVDEQLLHLLMEELSLDKDYVYEVDGPLDLTYLMKAYGIEGHDELREHSYAAPQAVPEFPAGCDIFEQIRKGDVCMHHPYQTFDPVVKFVSDAADDPSVLAIKQTLYRVSGHSPIVAALARAAENGKQVTVLVELKARFDEENNIEWAKQLEKAGCHVIYGLQNLKTHSKITLVVRREEDGIRRYVHLGTGNYNDSTAKLYTDVGLMTCSDPIGEDATAVFNMLSGYSEPRFWNKLSLAPLWLKDRFINLIGREQRHAQNGETAHIIAKMNSLCDPDVMEALYKASAAGVEIELIVRGICCIRPGIPGVSENITVRSIVGNFLEHSRIYYFENGGSPEVYAASADWMPRNLDRRVEIMFPLEDSAIRAKALHILQLELEDTVKAHILRSDGTYDRVDRRGKELINSQLQFCAEAVKEASALRRGRDNRTFIPKEPVAQED